MCVIMLRQVPLLWPTVAHTFLFTHLITFLLPTAHIGINGNTNIIL